jgi:hypothetical protein
VPRYTAVVFVDGVVVVGVNLDGDGDLDVVGKR